MAKIYKFSGKKQSDRFLDNANPDNLCDYLSEENPDLPDRVIDAMALAMIYSTYLSMVCEEENYSCQKLFNEDLPKDFIPYGTKTIH